MSKHILEEVNRKKWAYCPTSKRFRYSQIIRNRSFNFKIVSTYYISITNQSYEVDVFDGYAVIYMDNKPNTNFCLSIYGE